MRIPPTIAREIGKMYQAANVNDAAAKVLDEATTLLARARANANAEPSTAIADATSAVELLASVTGADPKIVDEVTRDWAGTATRAAKSAIELLEQHDVADARTELQQGAIAADAGALAAADNAAMWRHSADELAREYL